MAPGLQFRISEFRDELRVLSEIAGPFLAPGGSKVLDHLTNQVSGLWAAAPGTPVILQIDPSWPLETIPSDGAHDHHGGSLFNSLWCRITLRWTVAPIGQPTKNPAGTRAFEIAGEASTVIELLVDPWENEAQSIPGEETKVASWRMEVGNLNEEGNAAPGPLFHIQLPENPTGDLQLWPHWLSVPRLHCAPVTPMTAIEFALTEVFGHRWAEHVASPGTQKSSLERWGRIQELRLLEYFKWQRDVIEKSSFGTPLLALRHAAPRVDHFVGLG